MILLGEGKLGRSIRNDILDFIQNLPYWQRYLSAFLIKPSTASNRKEAIEKAGHYFLSKNNLLPEPLEEIELPIPTTINSDQKTNNRISKLVSISNLKNIAAVRENQTLPINEVGITVIFGATGSGKSSYARVMNDAFISRGDINVIGNVFDSSRSGNPEAVFTFKNDKGEQYNRKYPDETNSNEFKQYTTFDSKAVKVHIDSNNELHVTPRGFDFLKNLASLVSDVKKYIQNSIDTEKQNNKNTFYMYFSENSEIKLAVTKLGADSDFQNIKELGNFNKKDEELLNKTDKELAHLKVDDLVKKKKLNQDITDEIEEIKNHLEKMSLIFSQDDMKKVKKRIEHKKTLLFEISNSGIQKFKDLRFKDIGSEAWKKFINAGKEFLNLQESSWNEGDLCPYCRQNLTLAASKLIKNYEIYLKSEKEEELKKLDKKITELINKFQSLEILNLDSKNNAMTWLLEKESGNISCTTIKKALSYYFQLKDALIKNLKNKNWYDLGLKHFKVDWTILNKTLEKEKESFNLSDIEKKKRELDTQIVNLKHKKILNGLLPEIESFATNTIWIQKCEKAQNKICTNTITIFSKKLYKKYVTNSYREQFKKECSELHITNPALKQIGVVGEAKRSYTIGSSDKLSNVLSEGEQRAVALADFFTDAKISKINGGLIFDDPVASQDHERKELIARKLVQESCSRQIIVFTHDLAFLYDLVNETLEKHISIIHHWISSNGINDVGIVNKNCKSDFESDYVQPDIAKKCLEKAEKENNPMERKRFLREGVSALRTSYEAFFIVKVLNKVIIRFDRRIKYNAINEIYAPAEILDKISSKLADLSKNISGHLQTDTDAFSIAPDMLKKEINEYKDLYDKYVQEKKRRRNILP